jgi:hypothetical protein
MTVGTDLRRSNVPVAVAFLFARIRSRTLPLETVGLLLWSAAGSGIAVLLVSLQAVSMELPHPLSGCWSSWGCTPERADVPLE